VINLETKQVGLVKYYRSGAKKNDLVGQFFGGGWVNTLSAVTVITQTSDKAQIKRPGFVICGYSLLLFTKHGCVD